ncbi:MAG: protein kinase [Pseudomonadota bacterium]
MHNETVDLHLGGEMQQNEVVDLEKFRVADAEKTKSNEGGLQTLPAGTRLLVGQYKIEGYLNCGGFGITYVARDSLGRKIVIKECFPSEMAFRRGKTMLARSPKYQDELDRIVRLFVTEAHNLANVRHENIVHVHQIFEENDTAYMAMDFIDGPDLLDLLDNDQSLPPKRVQALTRTMLGAISYIHSMGMLHRDISPDNILISPSGAPVLIDFGAARQHVQYAQRKLSRMKFVKDGYSPQEFYVEGSPQGTSSDLYSFAASMYHLISREAPVDAPTRIAALARNEEDPYRLLAGNVTGYPQRFLRAIDTALAVLPQDRVQTADDWLDRITPAKTRVVTAVSGPSQRLIEGVARLEPQAFVNRVVQQTGDKRRLAAGVCTIALLLGVAALWLRSDRAPLSLAPTALQSDVQTLASETSDASDPATVLPVAVPVRPLIDASRQLPETSLAAAPVMDSLPRVSVQSPAPPLEETPASLAAVGQDQPPSLAAEPGDAVSETPEIAAAAVEAVPSDIRNASPNQLPVLSPGKAPAIGQNVLSGTSRTFAAGSDNGSGGRPIVDEFDRAEQTSSVRLRPNARKQPTMPSVPTVVPEPPADLALAAIAPTAYDPLSVALPPVNSTQSSGTFASVLGIVADTTAPVMKVSGNPQIARVNHSYWDVDLPFKAVATKRHSADVFVVNSDGIENDLTGYAPWLTDGVVLFAFNGERFQEGATLEEHFMGALSVASDGRARAVLRYANPKTGVLERAELAVPVVRKTRLADGTLLLTEKSGDTWVTTVGGLGFATTDLKVGDVVIGASGNAPKLMDPASVEAAFDALIQTSPDGAEFAVLRNGERISAVWSLPGG